MFTSIAVILLLIWAVIVTIALLVVFDKLDYLTREAGEDRAELRYQITRIHPNAYD